MPSFDLQPSVLNPSSVVASFPHRASRFSFLNHAGLLVTRLTDVTLSPNASNLPGSSTLQKLVNGLAGWALILALAALLIGAVLWAFGSHSQNYQQSMTGRRAVIISGVAALLVGAAPTLINFFFHTGQSIH